MTLRRGSLRTIPKEVLNVRVLVRDDLELLKVKRTRPVVQRFRDPHHKLARLIAMGTRLEEAAAQCGYSMVRVYMLNADPAFQELVAEKRKLVDQVYAESVDNYFELATSNMLKAERQIAERLDKADEEEELLPVRDLINISRDAADRFGYGKKTTNVNINVDFAAKLEAARRRSGKTIEHQPLPVTPPSLPSAGGAGQSSTQGQRPQPRIGFAPNAKVLRRA